MGWKSYLMALCLFGCAVFAETTPDSIQPRQKPVPPKPVVLVAPVNLALTVISASTINLSWVNPNPGNTGAIVQRAGKGGGWTQIAKLTPGISVYNDSGLKPKTLYRYRVLADN